MSLGGRAGLPARAAGARPVAVAARGGARGRDPVDGLHGTLMTENAFYPLFLTARLGARAATSSGRRRGAQLVLLAAVLLRVRDARAGARARPGDPRRAALLSLLDRRGLRGLRDHVWLYGIVGGAGRARDRREVARGALAARRPRRLRVGGRARTTRVVDVARWFLYHVAELDLSLGVLPFAALIVLVGVARRLAAAVPRVRRRGGAVCVFLLARRSRSRLRAPSGRRGSRSGTSSTSRRSS